MEAAAAGVLYTIETIAEGALAAAKGLTMRTAPLKARFTRIKAPDIPRSSHSLAVIKGRAYIFGGEINSREPVDNAMHVLILPTTSSAEADYKIIYAKSVKPDGDVPAPRVGHTAAAVGHNIYVFGGRGGPEMKALEENGRVWVFDTETESWSHLDPSSNVYPGGRSYHASTATPYPSQQNSTTQPDPNIIKEVPDAADVSRSEPPTPNTYGTIFIHAGCLSNGERTSDLWAFDISSSTWAPMPSAPDAPRGGSSLTIVRDRLYRFGGFDGSTELGGQIDFLDLNLGAKFSDKGGTGEMAVSPRSDWKANVFPTQTGSTPKTREDPNDQEESKKELNRGNKAGPAARSVCAMAPVTTGQGREYLLIAFGEGKPSAFGHSAAGRFFDDIWSFQLKSEGGSAASVKDAGRQYLLPGKQSGDTGEAECVETQYFDGTKDDSPMIQEGQEKPMQRRGWMASDSLGDLGGGDSILVFGGLSEENKRLGDAWIISVS